MLSFEDEIMSNKICRRSDIGFHTGVYWEYETEYLGTKVTSQNMRRLATGWHTNPGDTADQLQVGIQVGMNDTVSKKCGFTIDLAEVLGPVKVLGLVPKFAADITFASSSTTTWSQSVTISIAPRTKARLVYYEGTVEFEHSFRTTTTQKNWYTGYTGHKPPEVKTSTEKESRGVHLFDTWKEQVPL